MDSDALSPRIRVSCAGLCRIQDPEGRWLLGLNQNRARRGIMVYTPLGGALRYFPPSLPARFDAIPENPAEPDLRLLMPPSRLHTFRHWFYNREERETDPYRELCEELVDEYRLLPGLERWQVNLRHRYSYENIRPSDRDTAGGQMTAYFHDVFEVTFLLDAHRQVIETASRGNGLRWFTSAELERGRTPEGATIEGSVLLGK